MVCLVSSSLCLAFLFYALVVNSNGVSSASQEKSLAKTHVEEDNENDVTKRLCQLIPNEILKCSEGHNIGVLSSHCLTYNKTKRVFEAGRCILYNLAGSFEDPYPYKQLTVTGKGIEKSMCAEFKRAGTLCGKCMDGYYPLVHSFDLKCIQCTNGKSNWWKFVLAAFLPLTIFYFFILLFKISVISSQLHGFVIYSQALTMPALAHTYFTDVNIAHNSYLRTSFQFIATLCGIWNLDFFRFIDFNICLGTDTLQTLALDLAVGIYPFLLMLLSYILISLYDRNFRFLVIIWKPFHKIFSLFQQNWNVKTSLIDAFVTFILLSSVKFLSVSNNLLTPVEVHQINSTGNLSSTWRLLFDADVPYFGERHLPYAILAILVLAIFVITPTLLLIAYPFLWFQKLLNIVPIRWYILHTLMDSFQGHYKDGTQSGTRDRRWFASTFLMLRLIVFVIGMSTYNLMFFPLAAVILIMLVILLVNLHPFKESNHTVSNGVFLLVAALSYTTITGLGMANYSTRMPLLYAAGLNFILPIFYVTALTLHWMYRHRKSGSKFLNRLRWKMHGYNELP